MDSLSLDIILLPQKEIAKNAIKLSKFLSKNYKTYFMLDGRTKFPHLTLFQLKIPRKNLIKLQKSARRLFTNQKVINSTITGYGIHKDFLSLKIRKEKQLDLLHKMTLALFNPLREGLIVSSQTKLTREIEQYGTTLVSENFWPHITITRLANENDAKRATDNLPKISNSQVKFEEAAIGFLSDHGTVVKILKRYWLK